MDINQLISIMPKGWQKTNTVFNEQEHNRLIAATGEPDFMIIDKTAVILKGSPLTMQGVKGMFVSNIMKGYHIDAKLHPEGTIVKAIKDDEVLYGVICKHEGGVGVFFALGESALRTKAYRSGEQIRYRTYFLLMGESHIVHDTKGPMPGVKINEGI